MKRTPTHTVVVSSVDREGEAPMPTYYLGLDVHKVRTQYCLMDPTGEILREGKVPTQEASGLIADADTAVVLEATGSWHFAYDALVATGATVKLAHPARVKAIASARIKTDKIDARILAHLLRTDLIPEVVVTERGYGKRTSVSDYPQQNRAGWVSRRSRSRRRRAASPA